MSTPDDPTRELAALRAKLADIAARARALRACAEVQTTLDGSTDRQRDAWRSVVSIAHGIEAVADLSQAPGQPLEASPSATAAEELPPLGVVGQHIVRTCREIFDDLEPSGLPAIPRGTFGIASDDAEDYGAVDFGPPWGIQHIGNHDLVDAPAVLLNAMRAIVVLRRPWRQVIRRTLRGFAGPYLVVATGGEDFAVERHLAGKGRRAGLKLLAQAAELASKPECRTGAREQGAYFIAQSRKRTA